jgi:hypothetical protein
VDDLLLSEDNQEEVINTTFSFINFLGSKGLHISKNKLQFAGLVQNKTKIKEVP